MRLNLLQFDVDVLAPAINDYANLSSRISESFENLQGSLCTANSGDIHRHDQQNVIRQVERSNGDRIERVRQVKNEVFMSPTHNMKKFGHVLDSNIFSFVCFQRRCQ